MSERSLSTHLFGGRNTPAPSAVDRLADPKKVTQLSAVIGNRARDSSLQINGHVADELNNFYLYCLLTRDVDSSDHVQVNI